MKYLFRKFHCLGKSLFTIPSLRLNIDTYQKIKILASSFYYSEFPAKEYPVYLKKWYFNQTGRKLDLEHRQTFEEKIQFLKLQTTSLHTKLVDKFLVREWIKDAIGEEYLIDLLGVYNHFNEIDFSRLPSSFVMKCNHGSGWNIIVKNKNDLDIKKAKDKLEYWLLLNYAFCNGLELQYKDVPPKIIIEKYIAELEHNLYDYRFYCFNGIPKFIFLDIHSGTPNHRRKIYDIEWNELPIKIMWPPIEGHVSAPECLNEMISLTRRLCKEFVFVRVDFYVIENQPKFGEMTFTPMGGIGMPDDLNVEWGRLLTI